MTYEQAKFHVENLEQDCMYRFEYMVSKGKLEIFEGTFERMALEDKVLLLYFRIPKIGVSSYNVVRILRIQEVK